MGRAQPGVDDACRSSATAQVDAVMLAARVLVAITAQSVAALEAQVTLPQLRVLAMVASDGPLNLGAVARGLGVHPSNATRACDRLVAAGLLHRGEDAVDRRNLILELTAAGRQLVQTVIRHRRASIQDVLSRMSGEHRRELVPTLNAFARAAGEIPNSEPWVLGWTTERPAGDNVATDDRTT